MSKSTQLVTATYIAAFVGSAFPSKVNTDDIAKAVKTHPSRVRRLVSKLVKAGVFKSHRGSAGGVVLAREASKITLADICDAVQEQTILSLGFHDPIEDSEHQGLLRPIFEKIYEGLEKKIREDLEKILLADILEPWQHTATTS